MSSCSQSHGDIGRGVHVSGCACACESSIVTCTVRRNEVSNIWLALKSYLSGPENVVKLACWCCSSGPRSSTPPPSQALGRLSEVWPHRIAMGPANYCTLCSSLLPPRPPQLVGAATGRLAHSGVAWRGGGGGGVVVVVVAVVVVVVFIVVVKSYNSCGICWISKAHLSLLLDLPQLASENAGYSLRGPSIAFPRCLNASTSQKRFTSLYWAFLLLFLPVLLALLFFWPLIDDSQKTSLNWPTYSGLFRFISSHPKRKVFIMIGARYLAILVKLYFFNFQILTW